MVRKVIAIIPARSGSKGIPDKNILKIGDKTLIEWAVSVAKSVPEIDEIIIDTDSKKYEKIALNIGASSFGLRPDCFATDNSKTVDSVLDLFEKNQELDSVEFIVLLQPTSPFRSGEEISAAIRVAQNDSTINALVSISLLEEPHPMKLKKINSTTGLLESYMDSGSSEMPRQTLDSVYRLSGDFYLVKKDALINSRSFFPEYTYPWIVDEGVNIDTLNDYKYAKYIYESDK